MQGNLFQTTNVEAPVIKTVTPIRHPQRRDTVLGATCVVANRDDQRGIYCRRSRYSDDDGNQDYFRKHSGYSMIESAIEKAIGAGCERLFIEEYDNDRVLEYDIHSFLDDDTPTVDDHKGTLQRCCPVDKALLEWDQEDIEVDHNEFH